ncbi:tetratricopeptide repeat protein [Ostreibacterium oceani]|uniref:Tetratricopeptide repeat protein n=1 Tax=Ostreibacterium oceani TaxID=2654998 RepID=A0A6N7EWH7_9GAMM|nr:tetratricopeptide repeat protein [Ostreibacterium oceani]MPV85467.1 tetratricopeptide repeat protein [Ostreibacterium oceani]
MPELAIQEIAALRAVFNNLQIMAVVAIILLMIVSYALFKNTLSINRLQASIQRDEMASNEQFNVDYADRLFDKGEIKTLSEYCEQYLDDNPNSVHVHWYYALAHYNTGDYEAARNHFENVIKINPLWKDGAMVYLQEIASKAGRNKTRDNRLH